MISFKSVGLEHKLYSCNNIDVSNFMDADMLDYIFNNYLFFKSSDKQELGFVKYNYGIRSDKFDNFVNDETIGAKVKTWLMYYFILEELNSCDISILSCTTSPSFVNVYFGQNITEYSVGGLLDLGTSTEGITDYMDKCGTLSYNKIIPEKFHEDYAYVSHTKTLSKFPIDNLIFVETNNITNDDIDYALEHFITSTEAKQLKITDMVTASRFALKVTLDGNVKYIILEDVYVNYIFTRKLKDMFGLIDIALHDQLWSYEEISYLYPKDNKINFIEGFTNEKTVSLEANILNPYLKSYVVDRFFNGNLSVDTLNTVDFYNMYNEMCDSICRYIDDIGKGIAYFDFTDEYINANIGSIDEFQVFKIIGFDNEKLSPILLCVGKDYQSEGGSPTQYRKFSIFSGGIDAINKDELLNNFNSEYVRLVDMLLLDVNSFDPCDIIGMCKSVYGLTSEVMPLLMSGQIPVDNTFSVFYDDRLVDADSLFYSVQAYKHPTSPVLLNAGRSLVAIDEDTGFEIDDGVFNKKHSMAIPYDAMLELLSGVISDTTYDVWVEKQFYTSQSYPDMGNDLDNIIYNNMYIEYLPIFSVDGLHNFSDSKSPLGFRKVNEIVLRDITVDVKHNLHIELFNNTLVSDIYEIVYAGDIVNINDDSDYDPDSSWYSDILTNNIDALDIYNKDDSEISEFLSMLMNETVYHTMIENSSETYVCSVIDLSAVNSNSYNNSTIYNKVIGSDQYSYYSLQSNSEDPTFSGYFISSYTDNRYAQYLLDLDNAKIKNIATTAFEFNCGTANPIVTNLDTIVDNTLYVINKSDYSKIIANWYNVFKIYDVIDYNIIYSNKPYENIEGEPSRIFNVYANEKLIVKQ